MSGVLREPDRPDSHDQNDTGPGDVEMLSESGLDPPDDLGEVGKDHQGGNPREPDQVFGNAGQDQAKEREHEMNEDEEDGKELPAGRTAV